MHCTYILLINLLITSRTVLKGSQLVFHQGCGEEKDSVLLESLSGAWLMVTFVVSEYLAIYHYFFLNSCQNNGEKQFHYRLMIE